MFSDVRLSNMEYWCILYRLVPLLFVGGIVAVATNFTFIVEHQATLKRQIIQFIPTFFLGCTASGVSVLGLSLFVQRPTPELEMLAAVMAGMGGQKVIDVYLYRLFGARYFDNHQCHCGRPEDNQQIDNHQSDKDDPEEAQDSEKDR